MPATRDDLMARLASLDIAAETVDHAPVFTVEEAQTLRGIPGANTKNLFLKDKKDALFLVVAPEDALIDLKHLHRLIGAASRLSFGRPELLMETLGVLPGSVTAFAAMNDTTGRVSVILDEALLSADRVNGHPLVNTATTTVATSGLLTFLRATGHEPRIVALSATPDTGQL